MQLGRAGRGAGVAAGLGLLLLSAFLFQPLGEGLRYTHRRTEAPHSIHILEVHPGPFAIVLQRALDDGLGRETVSSMAQRVGAVGAINGGFFRVGGRYSGEPVGILKIEDRWFSDPHLPRGALGWTRDLSRAVIGRVSMTWEVQVAGQSLPVHGLNRPRSSGQALLYNWAFHRSTLTDPDGWELEIQEGRITAVRQGGNSQIPPAGWVYSVGPRASVDVSRFAVGEEATISYTFHPSDAPTQEAASQWEGVDYIVGGTPILVRNGERVSDFDEERIQESFVRNRHPRTAVGIRPDGTWVLVVVDGRQPNLSLGMTLEELAELMQSLGSRDALNLDGGGSSTFYFQGRVVNSPSDVTGERPVSDALLVVKR